MKVVAKKQTKIILVISLILLLLIGLVVIFKDRIILFSKIKSFGKLDKYSHLIDDCEVEKKKGEVVLHCKGVLKSKKRTIEEECIKVEILTNDDTDLREEDLCIDIGGLDWEDPYGRPAWYIPIHINLKYQKSNILSYASNLIQLSIINDYELDLLFKKNQKLKNLKRKLLTENLNETIENNYIITEYPLTEDETIDNTSFYKVVFKSASVVDSKLKLTFETIIRGKKHNIIFYTTRFFYEDNRAGTITLLTPEDFSELKVDQSYIMVTMSTNHMLAENINDYCSTIKEKIPTTKTVIDLELFSDNLFGFCTIKPDNYEDMFIQNVERYIPSTIKEAQEKGKEEIVLNKLLLFEVVYY